MIGKIKSSGKVLRMSFNIKKMKNESVFKGFYYFFDILLFRFKYNLSAMDYFNFKYYNKNQSERDDIKTELLLLKDYREQIKKDKLIYFKYLTPKDKSVFGRKYSRTSDYIKTYNMGKGCYVQYNVCIRCTHNVLTSKFVCGNNVNISRNVDIDYTGYLEICNGVFITEGVKILTHGHDFLYKRDDSEIIIKSNRVYITKLIIEENVFIGSRSIIMPNVGKIGKNSIISAGSIVVKEVPANVVVAGNPAKIISEFSEDMRAKNK